MSSQCGAAQRQASSGDHVLTGMGRLTGRIGSAIQERRADIASCGVWSFNVGCIRTLMALLKKTIKKCVSVGNININCTFLRFKILVCGVSKTLL